MIAISPMTFPSPEAAVKHFIRALAANDYAAMVAATSVSYYDRYDYAAAAKAFRLITPVVSLGAPTDYTLYREMAKIEQLAYVTGQIRNLSYSLLLKAPYDDFVHKYGAPIKIDDDDYVDGFVKAVDPARLQGLEVLALTNAIPEDLGEESLAHYKSRQADILGADDMAEYVVTISLDGSDYQVGMLLLSFDGDWRVDRLNAIFGDTNMFGFAVPLEPPIE